MELMTDDPQRGKFKKLKFADSLKVKDPKDGRVAPRHMVSRIVRCRIVRLPEPLPMEAMLHDVSTSGLGIYAPAWLDPGTFLMVTIRGWLNNDRSLRAKVVHCTRIKSGCWLLGCSLEVPLSWQEVEDLL
jgi:hypothetical protein